MVLYFYISCLFLASDRHPAFDGRSLAAPDRIHKSDPPLNPLFGGDFYYNPQSDKVIGRFRVKLHVVAFLHIMSVLPSDRHPAFDGRSLAAPGRVYKSDPPLNPLLGGDFCYNPQSERVLRQASCKIVCSCLKLFPGLSSLVSCLPNRFGPLKPRGPWPRLQFPQPLPREGLSVQPAKLLGV